MLGEQRRALLITDTRRYTGWPTQSALRCTALCVVLPVLRSGNTNTVALPATWLLGALALGLTAWFLWLPAVPRILFASGFTGSGLQVVLLLGGALALAGMVLFTRRVTLDEARQALTEALS